jgi:hypothetical protein
MVRALSWTAAQIIVIYTKQSSSPVIFISCRKVKLTVFSVVTIANSFDQLNLEKADTDYLPLPTVRTKNVLNFV